MLEDLGATYTSQNTMVIKKKKKSRLLLINDI